MEDTHPAVLHGLLVELDLYRVQAAGVGEAVVLDGVISVIALVDRHCQVLCLGIWEVWILNSTDFM